MLSLVAFLGNISEYGVDRVWEAVQVPNHSSVSKCSCGGDFVSSRSPSSLEFVHPITQLDLLLDLKLDRCNSSRMLEEYLMFIPTPGQMRKAQIALLFSRESLSAGAWKSEQNILADTLMRVNGRLCFV
jgi:hypothetical protein